MRNGHGGPLRVLVVDDDVMVRMLLEMQLPDVRVLEAARVAEGAALAAAQHPDAVVVDVKLPDGDGVDLVRLLRVTRNTRTTPIIVVTAGHDRTLRQAVLRAGADEYLAKPFEPAELEQLLRRILTLPADQRRPRRTELAERHPTGGEPGELLPPAPEPAPKRRRGSRGRSR